MAVIVGDDDGFSGVEFDRPGLQQFQGEDRRDLYTRRRLALALKRIPPSRGGTASRGASSLPLGTPTPTRRRLPYRSVQVAAPARKIVDSTSGLGVRRRTGWYIVPSTVEAASG